MAETPITDAINAQFDAIDQQIDDLKNQTKEVAKEQAKKIKEDIQNFVDKKKTELSSQKQKTASKPQPKLDVPGSISSPDDIAAFSEKVQNFCQGVADILNELITAIKDTLVDLGKAQDALATRPAKSLGKLTEV